MKLGQRAFSLAELYELRDALEDAGAPQWKLDNLDAVIDKAEQRWVELASDQYGKTAERTSKEVEEITRVAGKLADRAVEVMEAVHDGRMSPTEGAKALAAVQRDNNKLREQLPAALDGEAKVWESVDVDADQYQRQVMDRFPALAGRARVVLDEDELNQPPVRRGRRRPAPAEGVDEDDLARGGYPSRRQA